METLSNNARNLTISQAASILKVNENTFAALSSLYKVPLNTFAISAWLSQGNFVMNDEVYIKRWAKKLEERYPEQLAALREFDKHFIAPRKPKGYNLTKVKNKKLGTVYHVRYIVDGKLVPTRWSTHTNDEEAAKDFAINNREKLLNEYYERKKKGKVTAGFYTIMSRYYEKNSPYRKRGKKITEESRKSYQNNINNYWLKFLKNKRIKTLDQIDTPFIVKYQEYLFAKGVKPQTVNHYTSHVSIIFDYLVLIGQMKTNPCKGLIPLNQEDDIDARGCYHVKELRGVFNKRWPNELSLLLNLLIHTTGMRNSEIKRIKIKHLIKIGACRFIDIPQSKSNNGIRVVPLHDTVYKKIARYITRHKKKPEDLLFCQDNGKPLYKDRFLEANIDLGMFTRQDKSRQLDADEIKKKLDEENITFYSGRHWYKTCMNESDLGDVEEYFMGHKVSADVAKRYNHRDKQGQEKLVKKAREVFKILDKKLFIA